MILSSRLRAKHAGGILQSCRPADWFVVWLECVFSCHGPIVSRGWDAIFPGPVRPLLFQGSHSMTLSVHESGINHTNRTKTYKDPSRRFTLGMSRILEKSLKDARKEDRLTMGSRQVLNSVKDSKLIILSRSVDGKTSDKIRSDAKGQEIPLVDFQGTSVALGKLCGLQFRISTISFTSITNDSIKAILNESQTGA